MSIVNGFYTVRLVFSKTGRARYISHLDLNRTMARVLRRAGIPLWYTEGFNKHPYITFAAPLSLGCESLCERMDFRLTDETLSMNEIVARVNKAMPEGLQAISAAEAVRKMSAVGFAKYRLQLSCDRGIVEAFLEQPSITVEKKTKKKGGVLTVDIKPHLQIEEIKGETATELTAILPCSNETTVNPTLLLTALSAFAGREIKASSLRLELYDIDGEIFA